MYALICIFILVITWMGFLTRILINLRRENEIKQNNQKFYRKKINKLKNEINDKANQGRTGT